MDFNFKRDINKTIEMIEKSKANEQITDPYYSKAYAYATINHKELLSKLKGKFTSCLVLSGSTAPLLNVVNMGAKKVTSFDISLPAFCFVYFQIASVLALDYKEYLEFMYDHSEKKSFNFNTYQKIREYLPSIKPMDVKKYFDVLYDYIGESDFRAHFFDNMDDIRSLFVPFEIFVSFEEKKNNYLTEEEFNKLKNKLKTVDVTNLWMDIREIPEFLKGNEYDKILLSIANHFIYPDYQLENVEDYISLLEKFKSLLKMDGIMQGALTYKLHNKALSAYECYEAARLRECGYELIETEKINMIDMAYVYKKH